MRRIWDQVVGLGTWDDVAAGFTWDTLLWPDGEPEPPEPPIPPEPPAEVEEITGPQMFEHTRPVGYAEAETGNSWRRFMSALSYLLDPIAEVTRPLDGSESWTNLASPRRVPRDWLIVLAQWAGVRPAVARSMTEEELRDLIAHGGPGFWRGTRSGIEAAVRRFLPEGTDERFLYIEEKADGDPYKLRIFTYASQTPPHVEEQIRDALLHAKPAGLYPFIYEVRVGQTWAMLRNRKATWAEVIADYADWWEVIHDEPLAKEPRK